MRWQDHVVATADTLHGWPRFRNTRIPVSVVLANLAAGSSVEELHREYPTLPPEAIPAALAYAADLAQDTVVPIPGSFGSRVTSRIPAIEASVAIRRAAVDDSTQMAALVTELGYGTSAEQMQRRLESILQDDHYETLVACIGDETVGFIGTRVGPLYEDDGRYGQIMALAVTPAQQSRGIGRMLLKAAESDLVERGVRVLVVTSGNHRSDAHAFYEKCGYSFTGRRYKKTVRT